MIKSKIAKEQCSTKMEKNQVARELRTAKYVLNTLALLSAFIVLFVADDFEWFALVIVISNYIINLFFSGFSEVISLLQKNVDNQNDILNYLKDQAKDEESASETIL